MKGIWIRNLFSQVLHGNISLAEGLSFGLVRIRPKPVSLSLNGIIFDNVDHIFWSILADVFINRVYLPDDFVIRPNDIVVDIGAHRGGFTCFAARHTSNKVFAFEPDPINFSRLQENIRKNNLQNVVAQNVAVAGESGRSKFYVSNSSSRHSLYKNQLVENDINAHTEVSVLSLDDCLYNLNLVDLLKMDCEGAEFDILMQATDETLNKINKLVMETHDSIYSSKIKQLSNRIQACIPNVNVIDQEKDDLGYLHAWKSKI